jgi:DNA-directed RNA polymerase specialized sigma24 family protein
MNTTSLGLLQRLKQSPADESGWRRLHDLYLPLIRTWLAVIPDHHEGEDLAQEVMLVLLRELPSFERRRHGSFRSWLRKITINRIRASWQERRKQHVAASPENLKFLDQLEDPASGLPGNGTQSTIGTSPGNCSESWNRISSHAPGERSHASLSKAHRLHKQLANWA